ncbi:hypothetical protein GUJ93_ZPchr0002g25804 [Zizania palustris]|uniref:Hydroxyproline-rich glycoprotein family protein n=1 Tax=Zizania palustris TaxID=103762 RepID=A0A8J5VG78_ZIZPA|nr:hypothetical protein GUJ93_ZPchr0002g25804 [Zizania palustris]
MQHDMLIHFILFMLMQDMKQQCDMKRKMYEDMRASYSDKGGSRLPKTESVSTEQLEASFLEYQEDSSLFTFRLKSLKQGQFHSLLTQAARHHAAQLSFFRRGLSCLEALEPHVKAIAEKHNIDYQFSGLEDDGSDSDGCSSYNDSCSDPTELSFDYEINDREDFLASRGSMDWDERDLTTSPKPSKENKPEQVKQEEAEIVFPQLKPGSATHSAPIFAANLPEKTDRLRQMRPSSTRLAYRLPTPAGDDNPTPSGSHKPHHSAQFFDTKPRAATNLWHSSPLMMRDYKSIMQSGTAKLPSSTDGFKKLKRESWSGPIPIKAAAVSGKPFFSQAADHWPPPSTMAYHSAMPPPSAMSPPKITELHLLPLPPANADAPWPAAAGLVGYSGPLASKRQPPPTSGHASLVPPPVASPLPRPPAVLARSL